MRQDVNLLFALSPPAPVVFLPVEKVIKGLVLWLALLGIFSAVMCGVYYHDASQLSTLRIARDKIAAQIEVLEAKEPRALDSALQKKVDNMAVAVAEKKKVVDVLQVEDAANIVGYTPYLRVLSERIPNNVWLTQMDINDQGMQLAGLSTKAHLVPEFADALKNKPPFKGVHFKYMDIHKTPSGNVAFVLSTQMPQQNTEGA